MIRRGCNCDPKRIHIWLADSVCLFISNFHLDNGHDLYDIGDLIDHTIPSGMDPKVFVVVFEFFVSVRARVVGEHVDLLLTMARSRFCNFFICFRASLRISISYFTVRALS